MYGAQYRSAEQISEINVEKGSVEKTTSSPTSCSYYRTVSCRIHDIVSVCMELVLPVKVVILPPTVAKL